MGFLTALHQYRKNKAKQFNAEDQYNKDAFSLEKYEVQAMLEKITQRSDFLKAINAIPVHNEQGRKIFGPLKPNITGRQYLERHIIEQSDYENGYQVYETDSGITLKWGMLDVFNLYPEKFDQLIDEFVLDQIAANIMQIGWAGKSVAQNTAAVDLSDVNKGWLALLAEQKPENVKATGKNGKLKIFGENADYANLDALAIALRNQLDEHHRNRNDLVFLVGTGLLAREEQPITSINPPEQDKAGLQNHHIANQFGGMKALTPPQFPLYGAVVTTLQNLSLYTHNRSGRYSIRQDDERKREVVSYWRFEGYVVEDLGLMAAVDPAMVILG
ncbi:phage major capsid protein, P2 family [Avibacterium sp. 21-586]|uniref:phage major capsid protein, P2 family n=1 Tax=Avibacterium sp. 21-586 TaxID=2911534 RepID=UPI002247ACEE|nr:phage major capsid protein, P2 family [Avibacterium sp. 21-586]MCW9709983.1 phage major capsid protein, P2 family [Avibacterium sp. 21-586]